MAKTISYSEFYIHDGSNVLDLCPKGTKSRNYTGDFLLVMQNFYPNGTMEFVVFTKNEHKHLTTFNREQMNDLVGIMDIVAKNKKEFYPPEFL